MGLDMYLNAKRYLGRYNKEDSQVAEDLAKRFPELGDRQIKEVTVEAGYWRKANAIHKWFVDNVQDGDDNCGYYYVDREKLEELKALCQKVLAFRHLAVECLPSASGFFFGSTEYGEWYFNDLENTVKIIDECLAMPDSWDFEYHSSW